MRIMTSMYTLKKGGAYDRFIMMVEAFLERGCQVHCLSLTPIPIRHPYYHNHVAGFRCGMKNDLLVKLIVLTLFPFYSLLIGWRERVDLFIAFGPLYAFLQALPKWILRKPMVALIRLDISLKLKSQNAFNKVMEYVGLIFSDRIITVNTAIREEIINTIGRWKKIEVDVLFNNIPKVEWSKTEDILEMREKLGVPEGTRMLVTAGVLTPRKNIETLLRGLSKLGGEDLLLLIIGNSNEKRVCRYREHLDGLIKKLDLAKRVMIVDWVEKEDLWKIFSAAELFVMPSLKEGMPNAMLEALGFNLPCIGSNIPGIKDILRYDELMFNALDEEGLADKMDRFFSDPNYFNYINELCQHRKKDFVFDWKEKLFKFVTDKIS